MRWFWIVCVLVLSTHVASPVRAQTTDALYLGNEGVLITRGETKILFDAVFTESFRDLYALVPPETVDAMMAGRPPFDGVDAIFVSHIHPDHFSSVRMIEYLRANPQVRLYAGLDVIGAIIAAGVPVHDPLIQRMQLIYVPPGEPPARYSLEGLEIEAYPIPHLRRGPMPHLAFRVTLGGAVTVMHLGDADPADAVYEPYQALFDASTTHALFVPSWLLNDPEKRAVLERRIQPRAIIGVHVPPDPTRRDGATGDLFVTPGENRRVAD